VIEKIFTANKDLKSMRDTQWTLTVINTPLTNSYILPVRTLSVLYKQYIQYINYFYFTSFIFLGWKYLYILRYFKNYWKRWSIRYHFSSWNGAFAVVTFRK